MENVSPIITAKNLNLWYGDFKALKDISLDMGEREITALIGPSGCGKSTFLKTLNRMNDLVPGIRIEGDVRLKGQDIFAREMQPTELRRRAIVDPVGHCITDIAVDEQQRPPRPHLAPGEARAVSSFDKTGHGIGFPEVFHRSTRGA